MIEVSTVRYSKARNRGVNKEVFEFLKSTPVEQWPPITVSGTWMYDGLQRILAAEILGYTHIPYRVIK